MEKYSPFLIISCASRMMACSSSSCSQRRYIVWQHGQTKRISKDSFAFRDRTCSFDGGRCQTGRRSTQRESMDSFLHARQGSLVVLNSSKRKRRNAEIFLSCSLMRKGVCLSLSAGIITAPHQVDLFCRKPITLRRKCNRPILKHNKTLFFEIKKYFIHLWDLFADIFMKYPNRDNSFFRK